MAKCFRLRISRILQSCRSKDPSNPVPSFLRLAKPKLFSSAPPSKLQHLRHVSDGDPQAKFQWEQEDKYWHVVAADSPRRKIYGNVVSEFPYKKKGRVRKNETTRRSADDVSGEETETLVSTDMDSGVKTIREVSEEAVAARLSVLEGKVRGSFAVVKRSEDPKDDFKRSMREMIVEKDMYGEEELEQLLHCFLSLNSRDHRALIVEAFTEAFTEAMLSTTTTSTRPRVSSLVGTVQIQS